MTNPLPRRRRIRFRHNQNHLFLLCFVLALAPVGRGQQQHSSSLSSSSLSLSLSLLSSSRVAGFVTAPRAPTRPQRRSPSFPSPPPVAIPKIRSGATFRFVPQPQMKMKMQTQEQPETNDPASNHAADAPLAAGDEGQPSREEPPRAQQATPPRATATTTTPDDPFAVLGQQPEPYYIEIRHESYFDGTKPDSSWNLAWNNFRRQGASLIGQGLEGIGFVVNTADATASSSAAAIDASLRPPECLGLVLSNEAVLAAEKQRIDSGGGVENVHPVGKALYDLGCLLLDRLFDNRPIQRFWFLETIARIPYFSYVSMLHLYESFGWFRAVELRKVHAAEDWNELHHLLIMESLGGNRRWSDRFLGYHVAFAYYWFLVVVYLGSPRIAYQFMELLEAHAVDTYSTFVNENRERLAELPPPGVATSYYNTLGDLYLFDDFMTARKPGTRRPPCDTLLDVFENIATDEGEHVKTMKACQDYAVFGTKVVSSHLRYGSGLGDETGGGGGGNCTDGNDSVFATTEAKRKLWKTWSEMINEDIEGN